MKFIIIGKNIDVTAGLKEAVENKLGKLERYFTPDTEVHVTLSVQRERQKIEVTIPVKGGIIRSEEECNDMYVSIDLVEEIIERQLRKYKTKLIAKHQEGGNFKQEFFDKEEPSEDDGEIKIVRTKNSASSLCIRKMPAYKWNSLDTISSYSAMRKPTKSMSCTAGRMVHLV